MQNMYSELLFCIFKLLQPYYCIYMQTNTQNMPNYMQAPKLICRIVHRTYSAYWSYICTIHFAYDKLEVRWSCPGFQTRMACQCPAGSPCQPECQWLRGHHRDGLARGVIPTPTPSRLGNDRPAAAPAAAKAPSDCPKCGTVTRAAHQR